MQAKNFRKIGFILLAILILALFIFAFLPRGIKSNRTMPLSVQLATVEQKPMPLIITLPGNVMSTKTVSVKAQVAGTIKKINFQYGDVVKKNQLLFEIEPAPFVAALKQAKANLAQDTASLQSLKQDLKRYSSLVKKGYVSQQQYEQTQSSYAMQVAKVASDQQLVEQAKISLSYTKITAPISGKTGNVTLKPGDFVSINSTEPLVIINQENPIEVDVNLSQDALPLLHQYAAQHAIDVTVWNEGLTQLLSTGKLTFIDNQIDDATGTILLKASVDNAQHHLWPGQFVTVQLLLTTELNALVIPAAAVHIDQQGTFIYTVKNKQVLVTRVVIERQINNQAVIKSGVNAGDQVVAIAPPDLTEGSLIKIEPSK